MLKLCCLEVGGRRKSSVFPVSIDLDTTTTLLVDQLKDLIKAKHQYKFPAKALTLYVAKRGGNETPGGWLNDSNQDDTRAIGALSEGVNVQEEYLNDTLRMCPLYPLTRYFCFDNLMRVGTNGDIHVLVELPQEAAASDRRILPRKRWRELNKILSSKKSKDSASVTWDDIRLVYEPIISNVTFPEKEIPIAILERLRGHLGMAARTLSDSIVTGKDAKRLYLIAPILMTVCDLFDDDDGDTAKIMIDETVDGQNIKATGRFEFLLKRKKNNKRICIVEAKKDDLEQTLVENLLGCEAMAEVEGLACVYGIVTNYISWIFLKSLPDSVERQLAGLLFDSNMVPTMETLHSIAGKIYAILSE